MRHLLLCLFIIAVSGAWAREHTVQRGETLESIARVYNISTSQLIEANPSASELFYVGLKLNIPEGTSTQTPIPVQPAQTSETVGTLLVQGESAAPQTESQVTDDSSEGPGWGAAFEIRYGFLKAMEGVKENSFAYAFSFSFPYWFQEKNTGLFASGGIGYDSAYYHAFVSERGYYSSATFSAHFIEIPLKGGYAFTDKAKKLALVPYLGLDLGFLIKGELEVKETGKDKIKEKIKSGKFSPIFRLGLMTRLWGFNIGGYFAFPLTDDSKSFYGEDGHLGINIGFGF